MYCFNIRKSKIVNLKFVNPIPELYVKNAKQ